MKKLLYLLLTLLILSGCNEADKQLPDDSSPVDSSIENVATTNYELYENILNTYSKITALPTSDEYTAEVQSLTSNLINTECPDWQIDSHFAECRMSNLSNIGYVYKDINNDNIDELIIGFSHDEKTAAYIISIYSQSDDMVYLLGCGWSRFQYYVGTDGYIYSSGSGGASISSYEKMRILGNERLICTENLRYEYIDESSSPWYYSPTGKLLSCDKSTAIAETAAKTILDSYREQYITYELETLYNYLHKP